MWFDWNCPQHITERYSLADIEAASKPLQDRIAQLEAELGRRPIKDGGALTGAFA